MELISGEIQTAPSDDIINERLRELVLTGSSEVLQMSPKQLREQLSNEFNYDMSIKKDMIRETLNNLIAELSAKPDPLKKVQRTPIRKPSAKTSTPSKTLEISANLEEFCRRTNPELPSKLNMTHVRSCIVQYVKEKELKDPKSPGQFILDDQLTQFVFLGHKKLTVKFFDIYKVLKATKQYSYWM